MAQVNIQNLSILEGAAPAYAAATAAGDSFAVSEQDRKLVLHVRNGDAAAHTVTLDDINSPSLPGASSFDPDVAVNVPAGGDRFIQLDQLHRFRDRNTGLVNIGWSAATGMSFAVLRLR